MNSTSVCPVLVRPVHPYGITDQLQIPPKSLLRSLLRSADFAKKNRNFAKSNVIFALLTVLLMQGKADLTVKYEYADNNVPLTCSICTSDISKLYFDVIVLQLDRHYINLPVPMLQTDVLNFLMRRAE